MTGRLVGRSTLVAAVLLLATARVTSAQSFGPAPILAGTWESQTRGNAYLLQVSWNGNTRRYEGVLVRQGIASQQVGFALGELCWVATPTRNPAIMDLQEEFRGANGGSTQAQWRRGYVRLDRTTPAELVTSSAIFHRVGDGNARRIAPGGPSYGSDNAAPPNAPQRFPQRPAPPAATMQRRPANPETQLAEPVPGSAPQAQPEQSAAEKLLAEMRGEKANPPPGWMSELPSVEKVKTSIPAGRDAKDTLIRTTAAFGVLEDLIEVFTGKTDYDLSRTQEPREAYDRFREYRRQGDSYPGAKGDIWGLAASKAFREEVLAKLMSPAVQRAYWQVRSATMAAQDARRNAAGNARDAMTALLNHLPSVDRVTHDMAGNGDRDSEARAWVAFRWLGWLSEALYNGRSKAAEYSAAEEAAGRRACKAEHECEVGSAFYFCRTAYWTSAEFVRALLDKYVPQAQQSVITANVTGHAPAWDAAMAMPAGSVRDFPEPSPACTTQGQYSFADEQKRLNAIAARKRAEEVQRKIQGALAAIQDRKKTKAAQDADAKRLAMADVARASKHADTTVFQVRLGVPSPVPDCEAVGHWESDADPRGKAALTPSDLTIVSTKTCLMLKEDGTTYIHWGDNVLPSWASLVETEFKADVLVSVRITIPSQARPPTSEQIGFGFLGSAIAAMSNGAAQAAYEKMLKDGPENVAKAQRDLQRKYKAPHEPVDVARFKIRGNVLEPEWTFPGLYVKYDADLYEDNILIELESVANARVKAKKKKDDAEGKL